MRFKLAPHSITLIVILTVFYAFLGSKVYFRHDDWLMLGNSILILPKDWSFLWRASWFVAPSTAEVWFFRPFFKLMVWAGFQIFSYHYWLWIFTHWFFILFSVILGGLALEKLKACSKSFHVFLIAFLSSVSLHFACVVWMGEGMMNAPQLLFLSLSLWAFAMQSRSGNVLTVVFYSLALGFKESSAFLPLLFWALAYRQGTFHKQKGLLLALGGLMGAYLIYRLAYLPFNPGYTPHFTLHTLLVPFFNFLVILFLPVLALLSNCPISYFSFRDMLNHLVYFIPFLALLVAPHLGHTFFSPGWFLLPGYFLTWVLIYSLPPQTLNCIALRKLLLVGFVISILPILWKVRELRWLEWNQSQRSVHQFLKSAPETTKEVWIENCSSEKYPNLSFARVVGAPGNLEFIWALQHQKQIPIKWISCGSLPPDHAIPPGIAFGRWNFPDFSYQFF